MGRTEPELFASDEELLADALDTHHPSLAKVDITELRRTGFVRLNYPEPFIRFADGFETLSGRFEFASEEAEANGDGRLPHHVPPREATSPRGAGMAVESLALVAAANHFLMNSMFANSADHVRAGDQVVAIHPDDAADRGLESGCLVRVHNERGEFSAVLEVCDRTRRGVVSSTKGQWPKLVGGSTVNATTLETDADMGRGAIFHDNQVFLTSLGPATGQQLASEATR